MSLTNAKTEFLNHIDGREVLCAFIQYVDEHNNSLLQFLLTTGWIKEEWNEFLSSLDFEYESGYGGKNLYGTIWYVDGTWSKRYEYYGYECWEHHMRPEIPNELNRA